MKKMKLTKVIACLWIAVLVLALNPIGASAGWKSDSVGWWYAENSAWYTGWKLIDGNWYYFYSDGYMAKNTTIDGYYLNSSGAWSNSIPSNYGSNLDSLGQEILSNISAEKQSFNIKYYGDINNAAKDIEYVIEKLKYTNPNEYYNVSSYDEHLSSWSNTTVVDVKVDCVYKMTAEMSTDLDTKAREIVARITTDNMDLFEKECAIHDWIVNNTKYDQSYKIYDPYHTLINHTGTCEGYSLLAQKMFTIAGIKSLFIEGSASNSAGSGSHAWNMVNINGKWYQVDITWDDPVSSKDILRYDYYNLTDKEMSADHTWDTTKYPSAN